MKVNVYIIFGANASDLIDTEQDENLIIYDELSSLTPKITGRVILISNERVLTVYLVLNIFFVFIKTYRALTIGNTSC